MRCLKDKECFKDLVKIMFSTLCHVALTQRDIESKKYFLTKSFKHFLSFKHLISFIHVYTFRKSFRFI